MKQKTIALFQKIASKALRPLPTMTVSEWADRYRFLSSEGSSEPGRWRTDRAPYQREIMDAFTQSGISRVIVKSCSQVGKALGLDTPLPTPSGWTTMRDIAPEDVLYDETGHVCRVLWKSEVMENHECYKVTFTDGTEIIADAGHKWAVERLWKSRSDIKTTAEMAKDFKRGQRNRYAIHLTAPLECAEKDLLIHPYLLGVWLGDGNSCSAQVTMHEDDLEIAEYIKSLGYNVVVRDKDTKHPKVKNIQIDPYINPRYCVRGHDLSVVGRDARGHCRECARQTALAYKWRGIKDCKVDPVIYSTQQDTLRSKLVKLNLLNNKHIPAEYLRGSRGQRLALVQGLMDTDGSVGKNGHCEITLKSKILIDGLSELLHSLGVKHTIHPKKATCVSARGYYECQVWRISFFVYNDIPVFRLRRKLERQRTRDGAHVKETGYRHICNIERVPSRPVACIAVDSPSHLYLAGRGMIPTHNSDIMNNVIGRFAHLAPAPIMMIQPTIEMAEDFSKSRIAPMVRDSEVLRGIFRDAKSRTSGNTILSKLFPGGRLIMGGANSPAGLASRPIKILLCDEVDRFPHSAGSEGDPIDLASKRMTTFWDRCMGLFSTPTNKGDSRIEDEYLTGTQEEWQHRCPSCGEWSLITHRQMTSDHEITRDSKGQKHVRVRSVSWECPYCGKQYAEAQMRRAEQKYIAQNPEAVKKGIRSFFVNCWASPWLGWASIMQEWLEAKGDPEREKVVMNTRFGEAYELDVQSEDHTEYLDRREKYGAELPNGVLLLTAAVDVQDNRLEYEICGWGLGEECWGIKKGIILGVPDTAAPWQELDAILNREYRFANGTGLMIARTFIDSGGHYTKEVYAYCISHPSGQRIAVKGASAYGVPLVYKITKQTVTRGRTIPLVMLGTDSGKTYVMDRLHIQEVGAKFFHFPADEDGETLSPRGYDEIYFQGLVSERKVTRILRGQVTTRWEVVAKDRRNEPLDLRVYNLACMQSLSPDFDALNAYIHGEKVQKTPIFGQKQPKKAQKNEKITLKKHINLA